jgi:hypothetical protein
MEKVNENLSIQIIAADAIEAINRAEVDIQISTAKKYPRDLKRVLNQIETLATLDTETAEDCFYALKRGQGNDAKVIEGLSVRFAEIMANSWGNIRVATRIIGNDGKMITAQGVCHDLENNVATSVEVHRRITDRNGKTYSDDMVVVTGNAASAIAYRNAILKVIPKAITKKIVDNVKQVALGKALDLETSRTNALANFKKIGVSESQLLEYLEIGTIAELDKEHVFTLKGLWNAIKEGSTTVKETFVQKGVAKTDIDIAKEKIIDAIDKMDDLTKQATLKAKCLKASKDNKFDIEFAKAIATEIGIEI